jgi:hypothetical protein
MSLFVAFDGVNESVVEMVGQFRKKSEKSKRLCDNSKDH